MRTMQWSEVQRQPKEVAAAVEEAGVICLERRGQASFVLSSELHLGLTRDAFTTLTRLLTVIAASHVPSLHNLINDSLPWVHFLPERARIAFAKELVQTIRACSDLDTWAPFGRMLHEWQRTAAIYADPALAKELSRPLSLDADLGRVMMPAGEDGGGAQER